MSTKEMPIFTKTFDFLSWLIPATNNFPRSQLDQSCSLQQHHRAEESGAGGAPFGTDKPVMELSRKAFIHWIGL